MTTLELNAPALSLPRTPRRRVLARALRGSVVPALGLLCLALPGLGSVGALVLGVAVAFAGLNVWEQEASTLSRRLLMVSVMGLGAGLDLRAVADVGLLGAGLAVGSIAFCLVLGWGLGRLFRVDGLTALLVAGGTAICGGSAIAAIAPTVQARAHQVTAALGTVFLLNAVALLVFPAVGRALGLEAHPFGLWCAIAIHDTSSVVGAALAYGPDALEVATTVKLSRALWIIPLTAGLAWHTRRQQREARVAGERAGDSSDQDAPRAARPWFILGFVLLAALVNAFPVLAPLGEVASALSRRLLVLTLFLVGAALSRDALRKVGLRPLLQGVTLWVAVSLTSLGVILALT